ncbi:hypothetical protein GK107_14385 [Geobacillus thermoleovorans]|uniref:hypothetical protein n=1 Tax=Geobacillus TaxID=129337 RepID=UPI000C28156E|nr:MULTISPECIES: hypothetical protein [Geobacillus]PJW21978.1 hypothetical protein CV632_01245 [Geobacillus thermodenitrificans]UPT60473.1 hypothetical protein GK107_14385 [Geobacillus thermoleovorans]
MDHNVLAARITKSTEFLTDCSAIANAILSRRRVPKSRVRKLERYRLFFEAMKGDGAMLARLADCQLRLLDENIELVAIYNALGDSEVLRQKARQIGELMKEREEIMKEIRRKVGLNGV